MEINSVEIHREGDYGAGGKELRRPEGGNDESSKLSGSDDFEQFQYGHHFLDLVFQLREGNETNDVCELRAVVPAMLT